MKRVYGEKETGEYLIVARHLTGEPKAAFYIDSVMKDAVGIHGGTNISLAIEFGIIDEELRNIATKKDLKFEIFKMGTRRELLGYDFDYLTYYPQMELTSFKEEKLSSGYNNFSLKFFGEKELPLENPKFSIYSQKSYFESKEKELYFKISGDYEEMCYRAYRFPDVEMVGPILNFGTRIGYFVGKE